MHLVIKTKGLERPRFVGLAGAGFNRAWTKTKDLAPCVEARRDDYIKGISSPGNWASLNSEFFCTAELATLVVADGVVQCIK